MNEVTIIFQGMVMWWMASAPAQVLVPDLTKMQIAHSATISAPLTAFKSGACPAGFTLDHDTCTMVLDGAGKRGGVEIRIAAGTRATAGDTAKEMCVMPKLQRPPNDELTLRPRFRPPSGAGNTAWMSAAATDGRPGAGMMPCDTDPDCPRYGTWTVPVREDSEVSLLLTNLASGRNVTASLNRGAVLVVANTPILDLDGPSGRQGPGTTQLDGAAADWCAYFDMVLRKGNPGRPWPCQGKPSIPVCDMPPARKAPRHMHLNTRSIETIACSNSQYP